MAIQIQTPEDILVGGRVTDGLSRLNPTALHAALDAVTEAADVDGTTAMFGDLTVDVVEDVGWEGEAEYTADEYLTVALRHLAAALAAGAQPREPAPLLLPLTVGLAGLDADLVASSSTGQLDDLHVGGDAGP